MRRARPTRRVILAALLCFSSRASGAPLRSTAAPLDKGIGGTGVRHDPDEPDRDRGIGGTGVVGTISRLDAMVVNGVRIMHPARFSVVVDGRVRSAAALRIGQTAALTGMDRDGMITTRRIEISSEVVGPVQSVDPEGLVVMGQRILVGPDHSWSIGQVVAVSGLRRADGVIQASLIEARPGAGARVTGVVTRSGSEPPAIGALSLLGFPDADLGQRCIVDGRFDGEHLVVTRVRRERDVLLAAQPKRLLLEGFVRRNGSYLALGSGLPIEGSAEGTPLPESGETRAVLTLSVGRDGDLAVTRIRPERSGSSGAGRSGSFSPAGHDDGKAAPSPAGAGGPPGRGGAGPSGRGGSGGPGR